MSKPLLGLILGAFLGAIDGLSAIFYPAVNAEMLPEIVMFSSLKSLMAGVIIGAYARKAGSLGRVLVVGTLVGLFFAFLAAAMPDESGNHFYLEIMTPGAIVGFILGYATVKFGRSPASQPA